MPSLVSDMIAQRLRTSTTAPFLFVGSGLSRRYADLEQWNPMLKRFAANLPKPYDYYRSRAGSDLPLAATEVAAAYHEVWFSHSDYADSRAELDGTDIPNMSFPLKYEIAKYIRSVKLKSGKAPDGTDRDREIEALKRATIDGIITTNWDTLMEAVFPDYTVYVGQDALLTTPAYFVGEIHKIHGSCLEPATMVLTKEDYTGFNEKNAYLAAKLLTVFIEHPIIFVGYSLNDPNIRAILRAIIMALAPKNLDRLRDRLIFVERGAAESVVSNSFDVGDGHTIPLTVARTNDFTNVFEPLTTTKRRLPARVLRQLKEHLYELVQSHDPKEKITVVGIEEAATFKDIEVVYGVGVSAKVGVKGYRPYDALDLFQDVMRDKLELVPKAVVTDILPRLKLNKYLPCFRYLRECGGLTDDGKLRDPSTVDSRVQDLAGRDLSNFYAPEYYQKKRASIQAMGSIEKVLDNYSPEDAIHYLSLLREDQINVAELRAFIIANMAMLNVNKTKVYFGALIGFYDCLLYKRKAKPASRSITPPGTKKPAAYDSTKLRAAPKLVKKVTADG